MTNGGDEYGVAFGGLTSATTDAGILNPSDVLSFTPDATWNPRGSGTGSYAVKGPFNWGGTAVNYIYEMKIDASTPMDYYQLRFTATEVEGDGEMWTQPTNFVLQVVPEPASFGIVGVSAALLLRRRRAAAT